MAKEKKIKKKSKKRDYKLYLYFIGIVILLVIIIVLIKSGKKETGPADVGVTPPVEEIKEAEEPELLGAIEKNDCGIGAAIGYKACNLLNNGDVKLTILHQGQDTLAGMKYYIYNKDGEKIAEASSSGTVGSGAEASYILPISQYAAAKKAMIAPVVNVDGADYICLNQGIMVPIATSCR